MTNLNPKQSDQNPNPYALLERNIRASLAADKRSVAWLAETVGIADKTFRRKLNAPEKFSLRDFLAIATALGRSPEFLLTGSVVELAAAS